MKVGFISLGCSKNLIDTEVMIGKFKNYKFFVNINNILGEIFDYIKIFLEK